MILIDLSNPETDLEELYKEYIIYSRQCKGYRWENEIVAANWLLDRSGFNNPIQYSWDISTSFEGR